LTPRVPAFREILRTPGERRIVLVRGIVLLITGASALLQPAVAEICIGLALVLISLLELGIHQRSEGPVSGWAGYRRIRILVGLLAGAALVLTQFNSGVATERVVVLAVGVLGVVDLVAGIRSSDSSGRAWRLARGALFVALAVVLLVVPNVAWNAVLLVGAVGLLGAGLLTTGMALQVPAVAPDDTDQPVGIVGLLRGWMRHRDIGEERRVEIIDTYAYDPPVAEKLSRFTILLGLAAVIATIGLMADSAAVIIGAMIIAPLMGPIVGIALGIVTGYPERAMRSLLVAVFGIVFTIVLAVAIGSWLATPTLAATPEIVARTSPSILDLVVALAAGAAGAYGATNRKVSDALAGVAISISLVPPLAVVGLLLGAGDLSGASGALLLFLTNFVSIVLAATVVFVLSGVAPIGELLAHQSRTRAWFLTFAAGALVLTVPLALAFQATYQQSSDEIAAGQAVEDWLPPGQGYQILDVKVNADAVEVDLAGPLQPPDLPALDTAMNASLGRDVATEVRVFAAITYPAHVTP
jgi:uncharacterized hydrophobic protein (TIGR00271 family)